MLVQFKFYNDEDDRSALIMDQRSNDIPLNILHDHRDPFFNECRAYGRLIEKNLNGKVAVHCYGYATIPAEREEELSRRFQVNDWDRPGDDYQKALRRRQPFRAIIKELVTEDVPLTQIVAQKMLRDLKRMRKIGIYPMDVEARNYKGGLLVDFSVAMTRPHYLFVIKKPGRVRVYQQQDLLMWQNLVEEKGIVTLVRAVRNREYCKKLRSHDQKK